MVHFLRFGKQHALPFTNKRKAIKMANRVRRHGGTARLTKANGCYIVIGRYNKKR